MKVPVAVSCVVEPAATEAVPGVIAIEIWVGEATKRLAVPLIPSHLAVIVECPTPCAVAASDVEVGKLATLSELDFQVANVPRS